MPLEKPLTPAEQELVIALLVQARILHNETISESKIVDRWHRYVDAFLFDKPGDDPKERLDAPHRVKHRDDNARLFGWGKYAKPFRFKPHSRGDLG